jgi:hypothetical protein
MSQARRKELVRILKSGFIEIDPQGRVDTSNFLGTYHGSPASAQIDLLAIQWALSHPLSLIASTQLVKKGLDTDNTEIALASVEALVGSHLKTTSKESRRKTRTVLLGALEGIGILETSGTGKNRSLKAKRGEPHPITFAYLLRHDLMQRNERSMMESEALESSLPCQLTQCTREHAISCINWCLEDGSLWSANDEVGYHPARGL